MEPDQMNEEMAADLAALEVLAADEPGAAPGAPGAAPAPAVSSLDEELAGLLQLGAKMAQPAFPSAAAIYSPQICQSLGAAWAELCNKHGWLQGGVMGGEYKEEVMCAVITLPLAFATYQAALNDLAAMRQAKPGEPGDAAPAPAPGTYQEPGAKTVSVGVPIQ